jgi:hypothetical protein
MSDVSTRNLVAALNQYGGLVIEADGMATMQLRYGNDFVSQFSKVPPSKQAWGALAGKFVHRKVIAEMNRATSTFHALNSMLDGLREAYTENAQKIPGELVAKAASGIERGMEGATNAARASQITYSARTWFVNWVFNVLSDHLIGARVFSTENIDAWQWAFGQLRAGAKAAKAVKKGQVADFRPDPLFTEAREAGHVSGFFESEHNNVRAAEIQMFGLDTKEIEAMKATASDRRALIDQYDDAIKADKAPSFVVAMQKQLAAVEGRIAEADKAFVKKAARWSAGWWLRLEDSLGQVANRPAQVARGWYNMIDEAHKLATYYVLREKRGMTATSATNLIKTFAQNYQEVPYYLRSIPSWLRGMVVSFPYELGRILKNGAVYRPARLTGFFSVLPMLNVMQFAKAGVNWDRADELLRARGAGNVVDQTTAMASSLYLTDPRSGNIDSELNFNNYFSFSDMLRGHGIGAQFLNGVFPPEKRNAFQALLAGGGGYVSNFVLNHPVTNFLSGQLVNRDPQTGQLLVPDGAGIGRRSLVALKQASQMLVPPQLPFGRDFNTVYDAWDAGRSNTTGRPEGNKYPAGAVIKGLFGVGVKGQLADQIWNDVGLGNKPTNRSLVADSDMVLNILHRVKDIGPGPAASSEALPLYGPERELRTLLRRANDPSFSPEVRAKAMAEADQALQAEVQIDLGNVTAGASKTDRMVRLEKEAIQKEGSLSFYSRLAIHKQAAAIILADRAGVADPVIKELMTSSLYTDMGRAREETDPGLVDLALRLLGRYKQVGEHHTPRLDDYMRELENRKAAAELLNIKEELHKPIKEMKAAAFKELSK